MLDTETKRRIDAARDILVGKIPNPASQVEQITIALIYKFMDDMDRESVEMGGKASFFSGEFEKYAWHRVFDPRMGGHEMLALYADAITRMPQNPSLPQLFRDIFKNAFLPYRDPQTLKLFLKTIDEFTYDHSERLGDAFEYLLSVMASQGDAGQFRTPRHIIDFMVAVIDPKKEETILDPACGTAGFLISAFKHILKANSDKTPGDLLSPEDRSKLMKNFKGYDISPDMVRLSLVNMYLHGFVQPQIHEYDTLTSEERWNDYADVILANPPFMSPKGGIKPHKRFSVQSNRSEVLFVDYMAEHLTPNGRAAIIVPEGIIFQTAGAYKQLRKMLVEQDYLWAVVSLPAGVFNPYAGVKTSILFLDRELARKTKHILFAKIEADGFGLGAQRLPIEKNDIPEIQRKLISWKIAALSGSEFDLTLEEPNKNIRIVEKSQVLASGETNLNGLRYWDDKNNYQSKWPLVPLKDLCEKILSGGTPATNNESFWKGDIPWISSADIINPRTAIPRRYITPEAISSSATNLIPKGNIIVVTRVGLGKLFLNDFDVCISQDSQGLLLRKDFILPEFLLQILSVKVQDFKSTSQGSTIQGVTKAQLEAISIPVPPLEIQKRFVDEIEGYQRIIDGARQVVENWKPNIEMELEEERIATGVEKWEIVKIGEISELITKGTTPTSLGYKFEDSGINFIKIESITDRGEIIQEKLAHISFNCHNALRRSQLQKNDLLFSIAGALGRVTIVSEEILPANTNQALSIIRLKNFVEARYLFYLLKSDQILENIARLKVGVAQFNISLGQVSDLKIPLPPLNGQHNIVARIESERNIIESNHRLVQKYEEKIRKTIDRVWEG